VFCNKQYYNLLTFSLLFFDIFSEVLKVSLERGGKKRKKKKNGWLPNHHMFPIANLKAEDRPELQLYRLSWELES